MPRKFAAFIVSFAFTVSLLSLGDRPSSAQGLDPMDDTAAYSLAVRPGGWDRSTYFPLGMLFPRDRHELINYGFDFTEQDVGPLIGPGGSNIVMSWLVVRNDTPAPPPAPADHLGLFTASWPWHLMQKDENIPGYGTFSDSRSYFTPAVRRYLVDSDSALARIYGGSPTRTVMWSLDNEWEGALDYTPAATAAFGGWLKNAYKTVPALNAAWGTTYADWSEVVPPHDEPIISRPAAWLDWHAFQDGYFTQMMADRSKAIYENDPQHRGVAQKTTQQSIDEPTVGKERVLDLASYCEKIRPYGGWFGIDIYDADDSYIYQVNFAASCIRSKTDAGSGRLFLTETNNHGGPGWQFANSIWRSLANGVKAYDFYDFGMIGAPEDPATYGFTGPNGLLRDKAPYAARFAYDVRRTEDFWAQSKPAPGVHRIALLLNRQDMLLDDNIPGQMWASGVDNRTNVYAALRQAGYWVDVVPYTKLDSAFLKQYDALVVVNGNHLTADECAQISTYVKNGGTLLADTLAGYYDEHHRVTHGLDSVLGVTLSGPLLTGASNETVSTGAGSLSVQDFTQAAGSTSQVLLAANNGAPFVFKNKFGLGEAIYINGGMGEISSSAPNGLSDWLGSFLRAAGIAPSYSIDGQSSATASMRVEQPMVQGQNLALVIASVAQTGEGASFLKVDLPAGNWRSALWSPAENQALIPISVTRVSGSYYAFKLPAVATSGMLFLFNDHPPLISIADIANGSRGVDGFLPVLTPGKPVQIKATVINTSSSPAPPGSLTVRALRGWVVTPATVRTPSIPARGAYSATVTVIAPDAGVLPADEQMYPINIHWSEGGMDRSVTTTPVGVAAPLSTCPVLLTDNATYPADFPRKIQTGATYSYPQDPAQHDPKISDPATGDAPRDTALFGGYSRWLTDDESARVTGPPAQPVPIDFDLKAVYPLHEVRMLSSDFGGFPTRMDVSVSTDDVHFTPVGSASPSNGPGSGKWLVLTNLDGKAARYVRLNVTLQNGNGLINEVEIWGYSQHDKL